VLEGVQTGERLGEKQVVGGEAGVQGDLAKEEGAEAEYG
jgi:hypothetical protein